MSRFSAARHLDIATVESSGGPCCAWIASDIAYNRIEAARAARRFPVILGQVESAAVTLTTIRLLAPHLTEGNHRDLLERARHKSKRDILELRCRAHNQYEANLWFGASMAREARASFGP